ncbi:MULTISPECIES: DUF1516 family protein [Bacillaceae]|uniref:DUF1516 family protein n=1 Tax=Bacillaceae TaxID=186817 RepID=UPI00300076EF
MTHAHITTIILTIILFGIILLLQNKGRSTKVLKMILRVMYLLIILTGVMMLFSLYKITILYVLKAVLGILMIGLFEMILAEGKKGKKVAVFWSLFLVILIVTVYLGLKLPMGIYIF